MSPSETPIETVDRVLTAERRLDGLANRALEHLDLFLPASGGAAVVYWDESSGTFTPGATTVPNQAPKHAAKRVRASKGASRWIVERRAPFSVADVDRDPFGANSMLLEAGNHAYVGAPLLSGDGGQVEGVLYAMRQTPGHFSTSQIDALMVLAGGIADAAVRVRGMLAGEETAVRVLIVDDDPSLRRTLRFILGRFSRVQVLEAATSEEAARHAEAKPGLCLFDVDLRGDTGPELYQRIRHLWGDAPPDVWFMTGRNAKVDRARDEALGVHGTLLKPISLATLRSIVDDSRSGSPRPTG